MGKIIVKDLESVNSSGDNPEDSLDEKIKMSKKLETEDTSVTVSKYVSVAASAGGNISVKGTTKKVAKKATESAKASGSASKQTSTKLVKAGRKAKALPAGTVAAAGTVKMGGKSMSGMVADSSMKAGGKLGAKASDLIAEAPENIDWGDGEARKPKTKSDDKPDSFTPKYSRTKAALIGVAVALVVGVVGFAAIWFFTRKPVEYCTVQFESSGGTQVNSEELVCGNYAERPEDPMKTGFIFQGWMFEGSQFNFDDTAIDQDIILVAKWLEDEGTETVLVHFDTDGGSFVEDIKIAKGSTILSEPRTIKAGYVFDGWYYNDELFDFMTEIEEEMTLVAKWKEAPEGESSGSNNNQNGGSTSNSNKPNAVSCDPLQRGDVKGLTLEVGQKSTLQGALAFIKTTNCKLVYKSEDSSIVSVAGATATAVKAGSTTISICAQELGGKEVLCVPVKVQVNGGAVEPEKPKVESLEVLNGASTDWEIGGEYRVTLGVNPSNADYSLSVEVSSNIVTCSVSGRSVDCKANSAGTVTVTVRDKNGALVRFTVTVKDNTPDPGPVDPEEPDPAPDPGGDGSGGDGDGDGTE